MKQIILFLNIFSYLALFGRKPQLFIFNRVFLIKIKTEFFQKMVKTKFVDFFEMNNFTQHFFVSRIVWPENGFFDFVKYHFLWIKREPLVKNGWLTNLAFIS